MEQSFCTFSQSKTSNIAKLALNDVGEPFNRRKKLGLTLTQTTEKRLKELCTRTQNDEINVEDFLKAIVHNIRKCSNDSVILYIKTIFYKMTTSKIIYNINFISIV